MNHVIKQDKDLSLIKLLLDVENGISFIHMIVWKFQIQSVFQWAKMQGNAYEACL